MKTGADTSRRPRRAARRSPASGSLAVAAGLLAAALILPSAAAAQEAPTCSFQSPAEELDRRASPPDSSAVTLGDGAVKVCYGSPRVRGREIFGGLVPYDSPWRLGANEPTTLHTTVPLRVGDVSVEPGAYALYAIPGREEWTLVVNAAVERWGIPIDEEVRAHDVGSLTVEPSATSETVEALTITLEASGSESGKMVIAWADTRLEVPLSVAGGDM